MDSNFNLLDQYLDRGSTMYGHGLTSTNLGQPTTMVVGLERVGVDRMTQPQVPNNSPLELLQS